jgi:hypothetical protein
MNTAKPARTRPATPITINSAGCATDPETGAQLRLAGIRVAEAEVLDAANDYRKVASARIGDYGVAARVAMRTDRFGADLGATVRLLGDDGRTTRSLRFAVTANALTYAHQAVAKRYRVVREAKR